MKKSIYFSLLMLFVSSSLFASKPIKSKVDKATVYLQGAHLYYQEQVSLLNGTNQIIFENISPFIDPSSLQAFSKGGTVMDIQYQLKYKEVKPVEQQYAKDILRVMDSIEGVDYRIKDLNNQVYVVELEKKMLLNFKLIKGESTKDSLPLLGQAMDFTHDRLNKLMFMGLQIETKRNKEEKVKIRLEERLNHLRLLQSGEIMEANSAAMPMHQVVVTLFAETPGIAQVNFSYYMEQAAWQPSYELQANPLNNKMLVKYFARVSQNSQVEWKDVQLSLSSSNPMERNIKPALRTWYISLTQFVKARQQQIRQVSVELKSKSLSTHQPTTDDVQESEDMANAKAMEEYVSITENLLRTTYEIKLPYTIPSDGNQHSVMVKQDEANMNMQFATVPKLSHQAFLMGRVNGWEELNLLPGNAKVFFDNAYIGETFINPQSESDTLDFNLGNDKSLVISRKKVKDKSKVKLIDNDKIETRTYEILVRNTKGIPIQIVVEDQIPVVQGNQEIRVKLIEADGASLDELTGQLSWQLKIGSKETKKIRFTYEVKSPKNQVVYGH